VRWTAVDLALKPLLRDLPERRNTSRLNIIAASGFLCGLSKEKLRLLPSLEANAAARALHP